jgi:glycosyltransferase involved in cell wall biosynthesis
MIPYRIDERMTFVNPLKLREYLSAGLPVVSTPVPEVTRFPGLARVASTPDAFVGAIEQALRETSAEDRAKRSRAMQAETWAARVANVAKTIEAMGQNPSRITR